MQKSENSDNKPRFKGFSAEEKLMLAQRFYFDAQKLKTVAIKTFHPELIEEEVENKVKKSFYIQDLSLFELFIKPLDRLKAKSVISSSVVAIVYGGSKVTHDIDLISNIKLTTYLTNK